MKIILSRKGFDSTSGGMPSPILPDGRMVSLPIPDSRSPIRYADINWHEYNIGSLVCVLTDGRIRASSHAHLDPDLSRDSLPRLHDWRPLLGQTGAAQGHLRRSGVKAGDLFLFFGLFRQTVFSAGKIEWNPSSPPRHVLWGWLQVAEVLNVDGYDPKKYKWAKYHPHFHRGVDANNTAYVARVHLNLPGVRYGDIAGGGVFHRFTKELQLTAISATRPSLWELPQWFSPRDGRHPLTYHGDSSRWQRTERGTRVSTVGRGQEFILDCVHYPEAAEWIRKILASS